jgi:hypothetical protein
MGQWVGQPDAAEAHLLVQAGATAGSQDIDWIASGLHSGSDGARWFYFSAKPALRALLQAPMRAPTT